jgi:hypothetical protein
MFVEALPSVGLEQLRATLNEVSVDLSNSRAVADTSDTGGGAYKAYIQWINKASRRLSHEVASADVDRLVLTRRSWTLQSMPEEGNKGRLGPMLAAEYDDRSRVFDEALAAVDAEITRWNRPGVLVVADTSFYINHPAKIEDADIASLLSLREAPIRLVVPMFVVDELDRLKRSGQELTRWRAGVTLAVLDRLLPTPNLPGRLRAEDFSAVSESIGSIPHGEVTIEIMFDPPAHTRLPVADDEIVDRALAVQARSGRPVMFLTYDTGQALRARSAGLETRKQRTELGPERAAKPKREGRRSAEAPTIEGDEPA